MTVIFCNVSVRMSERESEEEKSDVKEKSFKKSAKAMKAVVRRLENSLMESEKSDKELIMTMQNDRIKTQKLNNQLEEARKENKQLLNIIQKKCSEGDNLSRSTSRSQIDLHCVSTMSMVNLQYKYEELLASHEGLLQLLESHVREIQNYNKENEELREEIKSLQLHVSDVEQNFRQMCAKYLALKKRRDLKINKLKLERNTLKKVHERLVKMLSDQCTERDEFLEELLQNSEESTRALLLQEVRKTNKLQHENTVLQHDILLLRAKCESLSLNKQEAVSLK